MERIAGNMLFRLKAYVHRVHGADAWGRIVDRMPPADQAVLRGVILSTHQHDRTMYQGVLAAIDAELGRPALVESARVQAVEQFSGFFGLVLRVVPTEIVLQRASEYWRKSWTGGELRMVKISPDLVEVTVSDFEMPEVHRAHNEAYFAAFLGALTHDPYEGKAEPRGSRETRFRISRVGGRAR